MLCLLGGVIIVLLEFSEYISLHMQILSCIGKHSFSKWWFFFMFRKQIDLEGQLFYAFSYNHVGCFVNPLCTYFCTYGVINIISLLLIKKIVGNGIHTYSYILTCMPNLHCIIKKLVVEVEGGKLSLYFLSWIIILIFYIFLFFYHLCFKSSVFLVFFIFFEKFLVLL